MRQMFRALTVYSLLSMAATCACSLVRAVGEDAARARAAELLARALAELEGFGERAEPLRELARFAVRRSE